jgi:cell division protein FtsB
MELFFMEKKVVKNKKRNIIITALFCAFALYLVATTINLQSQIAAKERTLESLNVAYQKQLADNENLQSLIDSGDEAAYLEKIARSQYSYVTPDERVYREISYGE